MKNLKLNLSEENKKKLEELEVLNIQLIVDSVNEPILKDNPEFTNGMAVAKVFVKRDHTYGPYSYSAYCIIDDNYDLVALGSPNLLLEGNIDNIKQFGNYFLVSQKLKRSDNVSYINYQYMHVDKDNNIAEVICEDGIDLKSTLNPDIAIANNRLYSFSKNTYISREYYSIEPLNPDFYFVTDKISSEIEGGYVDYFKFIIDKNGEQVTNINSYLENGKYKIEECREIDDYEKVREMRIQELNEMTLNDKKIDDDIKKLMRRERL